MSLFIISIYYYLLIQIANFHNTIGERMIPSQRPMMLSGALELSRLVERQSAVSWGDPGVEDYLAELRTVAKKLANDNNILAEQHIKIREKVKLVNFGIFRGPKSKHSLVSLFFIFFLIIPQKAFNDIS